VPKHAAQQHDADELAGRPLYARIYAVVRRIPPGRVASYGQIAAIVGGCTPRMVGYALASLRAQEDVPWHRIINAQGKISPRADGGGAAEQQARLEAEGIRFDSQHRVNWHMVRWDGPGVEWLLAHGYDPAPSWQPDNNPLGEPEAIPNSKEA
jgi:methylated-DNA-protein-cysteine methyltransferase-like protein